MPNEGVYINRKITVDTAIEIIQKNNGQFTSAIGHQGSADAFNALVSLDPNYGVLVNRIAAAMAAGDEAIALKVLGRLNEGEILSIEKLNEVGFEFYHITNIGGSFNADGSVIHSHLGYLASVGGNSTSNYTHGK